MTEILCPNIQIQLNVFDCIAAGGHYVCFLWIRNSSRIKYFDQFKAFDHNYSNKVDAHSTSIANDFSVPGGTVFVIFRLADRNGDCTKQMI